MGKIRGEVDFRRKLRWMCLGSMLVALFLLAAPAFSQSCSLCYTQAASSGTRMIQALKSGILVLIIPPTIASVGLIFVVRRKSRQVRRIDDREESGQDW